MFIKPTNIKDDCRGFTLIELLLYIGLSAIILSATSVFLISLLESRVKNQTIATVNQEGDQTMMLITQTLRNAVVVNSPTAGTDAAVLSVDTEIPANNPTIFDLVDGVIRITEGGNAPVALTSNLVIISNLNFRNLSRAGTPGNVDVTYTVTHIH